MRHLLIYLLITLVALAVASCRESIDERLQRADRLVYTCPDSSLALLRQVDTTLLGSDDGRAYYALLWTQTAYRTGQFELADDSLAQVAVDYYELHNDQNERLARSLIYLGLHREVNGHPEEAMALYQRAEAVADSTDWRNLAQVNYRIGQLMSNANAHNGEDLRHYQKALRYYRQVGDTLQIIYSLLATGALLREQGIGAARSNLEQAFVLASRRSDSTNCARSIEYLARGYLKDSIHETAKELAVYCVTRYPNTTYSVDAMLDAACAYALMGVNDSAQHYLDRAAVHETNDQRESMRLFCLKTMAKNKHDVLDYIAYNESREQLHDSLRSNPVLKRLVDMERDGSRQASQAVLSNRQALQQRFLMIAAAVLVVIVLAWYVH